MRVAHLTTVDLSLRYLVMPQLTAVVELGGEAIGISAPGPHVPELERAGIRHIALPGSTRGFSLTSDLRAAVSLWRILRREHVDVLHTHNPKPGVYGRIVGRLAGVPVVVNTVHGLYATADDPAVKRWVVYALEAVASRFSDAELVQSREDYELLRARRITPRRSTLHLGNGVAVDRFRPDRISPERRRALRAELGAHDDTVVVATVGRLVAEKGIPEFVDAARRLDHSFRFVVVGPSDPEKPDALDQTTIDEAEAHGVRFLGMRTDVADLYGAFDIFVLASHREGFPRAAMEAAASGLPVIATDIRGCREVVTHGLNGLLVPVEDSAALAVAIAKLGDDAAERVRMGAEGRRRAEREFDESAVVTTVIETQLRAMRARGLPLPPRAGEEPSVTYRTALPPDAGAIAAMHRAAITTGFLPKLGQRFLHALYEAMIVWMDGVVLVADDGRGPVGFVAGVTDVDRFYRFFLRRYGLRAGLAAAPRLVRPANLRRAWETWRYEGEGAAAAELLAMAVGAEWRGKGIASELGARFVRRLDDHGVDLLRVVVHEDNHAAAGLYRKLGFLDAGTLEVHRGETSIRLERRHEPKKDENTSS